MRIHRPTTILPSEITPRAVHDERRAVLKALGLGAGQLAIGGSAFGLLNMSSAATSAAAPAASASRTKLVTRPSPYSTREAANSYADITGYNNFYEFGLDKTDPAANAHTLKPRPWKVTIDGECDKPGTYDLDALIKPHSLEDRVYRFRCVEAWSMVIPWVGFPLGDLLKRFAPNSRAKFVEFTTLMDPAQMPGQRRPVLDWPYREGLRMDEAMHPLAILAVGLYGEVLPNQNGAPLRLVVPWKYGFKNIKSIVRNRFTEKAPATAWNVAAPDEYGFFANVNPDVDHPRWSQARERRIGAGGGLFAAKIDTQPFNGYAAQVAGLYRGLDLKKWF